MIPRNEREKRRKEAVKRNIENEKPNMQVRGGVYDGMNPTHARDPYRLFGWEVESNPDGANPFS